MTLLDSVDAILMVYSYSGFPENSWRVWERSSRPELNPDAEKQPSDEKTETLPTLNSAWSAGVSSEPLESYKDTTAAPQNNPNPSDLPRAIPTDSKVARDTQVKMNVMSGLSILLTLMSILVAFRYVWHPLWEALRDTELLQHFFDHDHGVDRRELHAMRRCR
jgi:high-affinity nickel-transport protein